MERSVPGRNPPPPKVEWIPPMCGFSLEMHTLRESVKRWCARVCVCTSVKCVRELVCVPASARERHKERCPRSCYQGSARERLKEREAAS
jgi:hypothetical protein